MSNGTTVKEQRAEQAARLDRIENKIDTMSEAIVALARAEEKIHTLTSFSKQQSEQVVKVINRIERLEEVVQANASTVSLINKLFWIVITAAAASAGMLLVP